MPREYTTTRFIVVGAGGTGSYVAPAIARLMYELKQSRNKPVEMLIVDPDVVEAATYQEAISAAEVGRFKAQTLAERIALGWGLNAAMLLSG